VLLTGLEGAPNPLNEFRVSFMITVQPTPGAVFSIDSDQITIPAGLGFASIQDIVVGQNVEFHPVLPAMVAAGTLPGLTLGADSIRLESSEVTGTVMAVNAQATPPNFTLTGLPTLFTKAGITQITVDVVSATEFENVSGLGGIQTGDTVSVGGLLFNTSGQPTDVAERVFDRNASD
jgi:hypothetical protein